MEDNDIIALYFARDERAISETSEKYGGMCSRLAQRILGSREDAEECCNDVLLKVWNAIPPDSPRRFAAYLVRVVRNAALDLYDRLHAAKRGGTQTAVALEELEQCIAAPDDVEEAQSNAETGEMLNRFLGMLPDETRNFFVLRYVYLLPVKDIAEKTGVSVSKVKTTLHRTRNALKAYLGGEIP
jgi:RNA polymerase sigma-70 factor (ECF subfamily)